MTEASDYGVNQADKTAEAALWKYGQPPVYFVDEGFNPDKRFAPLIPQQVSPAQPPQDINIETVKGWDADRLYKMQLILSETTPYLASFTRGKWDQNTEEAVRKVFYDVYRNNTTFAEYLALSKQDRLDLFSDGSLDGKIAGGSPDAVNPISTSSSSSTSTSVSLSSRATARAVLQGALEQELGRGVKPGEVDAFLAGLNATERANPTVSTTESSSTRNAETQHTDSTSSTSSVSKPISPSAEAEKYVETGKQFSKEARRYHGGQYYDVLANMLGM